MVLVKDLITSKQAENEKLTLKQMLQILIIALPQAKPGNAFEKLLNEIRQIIYFFYQQKEFITSIRLYNNIMKSIKL